MAYRYDVNNLRQQNMFDNYPSMNIMDDSMSYMNPEEEDPEQRMPPRYQVDQAPPDPMQTTGPFDRNKFGRSLPIESPPIPERSTAGVGTDYDINTVFDIINRAYTPQTRAGDRFNDFLDNAPQRQEPSLMRKFAAAGATLGNKSRGIAGGIGEGEKVLNAPYLRDIADWTAKAGPMQQGAQLENTANINERTLAGNAVNSYTAADRAARQAEAARSRDETTRQRDQNNYTIAQGKLYLDNMTRRGNVKEVINDGKNIILVYMDGRTENTGMDGKAVSAMELAHYNDLAKQNQIHAQGVENRETAAALPKNAEATKVNNLDEFYRTHPDSHKWFNNNNGVITPKQVPVAGWMPWSYSQAEVEDYHRTMQQAIPGYQMPASVGQAPPNQAPPPNQGGRGGGGGPVGGGGTQPAYPSYQGGQTPAASQYKPYTPGPGQPTGLSPSQIPDKDASMRATIRGVTNRDRVGELQDALAKAPNQLKPQIQAQLDAAIKERGTNQSVQTEQGLANGTLVLATDEKGQQRVVPESDIEYVVKTLHWKVDMTRYRGR